MINIRSNNTEIPFEIPNKEEIPEKFHGGTNFTADASGATHSAEQEYKGLVAIAEACADASIQEINDDETEYSFPIDIDNGVQHGVQLDEQLRGIISETGEDLYVIAQASGQSNLASQALTDMKHGGLDVGVYVGEDPYSEDEQRRAGTYNAETGEIHIDDSIRNIVGKLEQ